MKRMVLTGAPGAGKTTVIHALERAGFPVFHDAATRLITSGYVPPIQSRQTSDTFQSKVFDQRRADYSSAVVNKINFYDRGIPDILAYTYYLKKQPKPSFIAALSRYSYDVVFIFSPWKEIFTNTSFRKETFSVACDIFDQVLLAYEACGYKGIVVPKLPLEDRISFIVDHL